MQCQRKMIGAPPTLSSSFESHSTPTLATFRRKNDLVRSAPALLTKQADDHFGAKATPTARTAQAMALGECFVRGHHDCLVCEHLIGMDHPRLVKVVDLLGYQLITKGELR